MSKENFFKELPIGLAMSLGMNEYAMDFYSKLDENNREKIKKYIQNCSTGSEAKEKIRNTINNLEKHNLDFLD